MANRPRGFGLTAEIQRKKASKFDSDLACEALLWISYVIKEAENQTPKGLELAQQLANVDPDITALGVHALLKDGVALCILASSVIPGVVGVKKFSCPSTMPFKQMENIKQFLDFATSKLVGCQLQDMFQTVDLYESQDISQVINGIFAFGRKVSKLGSIPLGAEEATANKREFTDLQLRASEGIIGLQSGSNKGANQSGQNFGKTRQIID